MKLSNVIIGSISLICVGIYCNDIHTLKTKKRSVSTIGRYNSFNLVTKKKESGITLCVDNSDIVLFNSTKCDTIKDSIYDSSVTNWNKLNDSQINTFKYVSSTVTIKPIGYLLLSIITLLSLMVIFA